MINHDYSVGHNWVHWMFAIRKMWYFYFFVTDLTECRWKLQNITLMGNCWNTILLGLKILQISQNFILSDSNGYIRYVDLHRFKWWQTVFFPFRLITCIMFWKKKNIEIQNVLCHFGITSDFECQFFLSITNFSRFLQQTCHLSVYLEKKVPSCWCI